MSEPGEPGADGEEQAGEGESMPTAPASDTRPEAGGNSGDNGEARKVLQAAQQFQPKRLDGERDKLQRRAAGKRTKTRTTRKQGRYITSRPARRVTDLALDATLREAAIFQRERRAARDQIARERQPHRVLLRRSDLRQKVRVRKTRNAVCFVVDASWSMAADERMRATKAAVLSLLRDAYQRRDRVGLVSFQRDYATLLLPLTNSVEMAQARLQSMPTGGKTPLSRGMLLGFEVLDRARRQDEEVMPLMVVLTDGQANVSMTEMPPQAESYTLADYIATQDVRAVVIDTEHPMFERGLARQLAEHLQGSYYRLDDLRDGDLVELVRAELRS